MRVIILFIFIFIFKNHVAYFFLLNTCIGFFIDRRHSQKNKTSPVSVNTLALHLSWSTLFQHLSRRYSPLPFPVSEHVRPKGVRLLLQRHDVLGDALAEQRLVLPPPTGRLPGHQAVRHVMRARTRTASRRLLSHAARTNEWKNHWERRTEREACHARRALTADYFSVQFYTSPTKDTETGQSQSSHIIIIYNNTHVFMASESISGTKTGILIPNCLVLLVLQSGWLPLHTFVHVYSPC